MVSLVRDCDAKMIVARRIVLAILEKMESVSSNLF